MDRTPQTMHGAAGGTLHFLAAPYARDRLKFSASRSQPYPADDSPTELMLRRTAKADRALDDMAHTSPVRRADLRLAAALSRTYLSSVPAPGSRISEVQAISDHIRRRRRTALLQGALAFLVRVLVVTAGIIIGVNCEHQNWLLPEAVREPAEAIVPNAPVVPTTPNGLGGQEPLQRPTPMIDEAPTTVLT